MTIFFQRIMLALVAAGTLSFAPAALAADGKGSAEEASALVKKAVAFLKKNGKDKSLAEFSDGKGQFIDRDMYIFVIDLKGKMLAHGTLPKIIGKDVLEMKDPDGKFLFKDMLEVANTKGSGWVNYKWPNPISKNIEAKATYVEKVDDMILGAGIYK